MKRDRLQDAMARRSPLATRESVAPVDLYTHGSPNGSATSDGDPVGSGQPDKRAKRQRDVAESPVVGLLTKGQKDDAALLRRRYTTYLKPDTIKAIKWLAIDGERNDYDVVQEALDEYLGRNAR